MNAEQAKQAIDTALGERLAYIVHEIREWILRHVVEWTALRAEIATERLKLRVLQRALNKGDLTDTWEELVAEFEKEEMPAIETDKPGFRTRRRGFHLATLMRFESIGLLWVAWDDAHHYPQRWTIAEPMQARRVVERLEAEIEKQTAELRRRCDSAVNDYDAFLRSLGLTAKEHEAARQKCDEIKVATAQIQGV